MHALRVFVRYPTLLRTLVDHIAQMKYAYLIVLCMPLVLSGCTIVGLIIGQKNNKERNKDKSVFDAKTYDYSNVKVGFETDKKIVKAILESTGRKDDEGGVGDRNVPIHCKPPLVQVCSVKENLCICIKDSQFN
ncbi:hypothetical protein Mag101_04885 [Microbulbifer agarilyticus]|uniref:Uncharacterized protein n=1 Tax=Microbulbifer agarilyticus TaxID=260552 RepID=A0A1Q2M328_9GAMM|nr:hypothetical protein Mag101_04885 [Microbulbifer agarilyticus]